MANPLKGEVELVVGEMTYTLCFPSNAVVEVEQLLGDSIGGIAGNIVKVEHQRALLWSALQKHHKGVDLLKAGEIMDDFDGGLEPLAEKLVRALRFRLSRAPIDAPLTDAAEQ